MAAYARQAKDQELILWATEIKVRAERRAGEMLRSTAERGERAGKTDGGLRAAEVRWGSTSDDTTSNPPRLADMGISKDQSSRWQALAAMPDEHFETAVATAWVSFSATTPQRILEPTLGLCKLHSTCMSAFRPHRVRTDCGRSGSL